MGKPDWKDAPSWASWLALGSDGVWRWFSDEPEILCGDWFLDSECDGFVAPAGEHSPEPYEAFRSCWKETLERRP